MKQSERKLGNESLEERFCILGVPRYKQEQNQKDTIYHIQFHQKCFFVSTFVKNVVVKLHV